MGMRYIMQVTIWEKDFEHFEGLEERFTEAVKYNLLTVLQVATNFYRVQLSKVRYRILYNF